MIHYYLLSAILEILGCLLFLRGNYAISIPVLILFAWSLTLQPYEPAKAYVIYGGIYILCSAIFATISGTILSPRDIAGISLLLIGVLLML
jgi:drug/metabolite transporter superfamily protein YnfA